MIPVKTIEALSKVLADTAVLYIKTLNFHWHVRGPQFQSLHLLFEKQYQELAMAMDAIAERILTLGGMAPASCKDFLASTCLQEGDSKLSSHDMIKVLAQDHTTLTHRLNEAVVLAQDAHDEGTVSFLGARLEAHEKMLWMLRSSL